MFFVHYRNDFLELIIHIHTWTPAVIFKWVNYLWLCMASKAATSCLHNLKKLKARRNAYLDINMTEACLYTKATYYAYYYYSLLLCIYTSSSYTKRITLWNTFIGMRFLWYYINLSSVYEDTSMLLGWWFVCGMDFANYSLYDITRTKALWWAVNKADLCLKVFMWFYIFQTQFLYSSLAVRYRDFSG